MDLESVEPLIDNSPKQEFKRRGKSSETLKTKTPFNINQLVKKQDIKTKKKESKLIFKIYLHLICQLLSILSTLLLFYNIESLNVFIQNNQTVLYVFIVIIFMSLIFPMLSDKILKLNPYNYIFFIIFTISLSYVFSKALIQVTPIYIKIGFALVFVEVIYFTIEAYRNNKEINICHFLVVYGSSLLSFGIIVSLRKQIDSLKLFLVLIIILIIGIYLIYDTNLIFFEKRRKFEENDELLGCIFLYIDIIQTLFDLLNKFYNSCEPERKPIKNPRGRKGMIFTGEEDYEKNFIQNEEKDEDENNPRAKRRKSEIFQKTHTYQNFVIKEALDENESDEHENDRSFKNNSEHKLTFGNIDDDNSKEEI
jgi:hypothetical protein